MNAEDIESEAYTEIESALRQKGKRDVLIHSIRTILEQKFLKIKESYSAEAEKLRNLIEEKPGELIGNTSEMREVAKQIRQIANTGATVLLRGSAGTGKEYAARNIHQLSDRKDKPFVTLNCDSLNKGEGANSLESELFGYERGAFTGATSRHIGKAELAREGTLFLDEIAELSPNAQAKLLEFVQGSNPASSRAPRKTSKR